MATMLVFKDSGWTIATESWTIAQGRGSNASIHYLYRAQLGDQDASSVSLPITADEFIRLVKAAQDTGVLDLREMTR